MPDNLSLVQAMSSQPTVVLGIALTCIASAAISIGALVTYSSRWSRFSDQQALVVALGSACGAVLGCTTSELLPESQRSFALFMQQRDASLSAAKTSASASFMTACAFVIGVVFTWALDAVCRCWATSHLARRHNAGKLAAASTQCDELFRNKVDEEAEIHNLVVPSGDLPSSSNSGVYRVGVAKIMGFAAQNILVEAALSLGTIQGMALGISLGVAITLFNLSEGMALARFVANASGMRWRAVQWCIVSSFSLPLGGSLAACVAVTMTTNSLPPLFTGSLFSVVSGSLVGLCVTQVLPLCFPNEPKQAQRISASVLTGFVFQAIVRATLLLTVVD